MIFAVNYTVLFTVIGKHVKKLRDYYALIATLNTDRDAIVTVEVAQSATYLSDGLIAVYETMKANVVSWVQYMIARVTLVLVDPTIVLNNFPFGTIVDVQTAWAAIIKEMAANDHNVAASVMTTGSITRTLANNTAGELVLGTKLDGYNPPVSGATPNTAYAGVTSQMYPDDETITVACTQDSENGSTRGAERFSISGTGAGSDPYSSVGENLGIAGGVNVVDTGAANYVSNPNFDTWSGSPESPDSWTVDSGVANTDFRKGLNASSETLIADTGYSLVSSNTDDAFGLTQVLNPASFVRNRGYFIGVWVKRKDNSSGAAPVATIQLQDDSETYFSFNLDPTSTSVWKLCNAQFIVPAEIIGDLILTINYDNEASDDIIIIDQIVITPCTYVAGIALAVFGGALKFIQGDTFSFRLQNDAAGKFQSFARKAYKVQLPTDGTPTISDSLVA